MLTGNVVCMAWFDVEGQCGVKRDHATQYAAAIRQLHIYLMFYVFALCLQSVGLATEDRWSLTSLGFEQTIAQTLGRIATSVSLTIHSAAVSRGSLLQAKL